MILKQSYIMIVSFLLYFHSGKHYRCSQYGLVTGLVTQSLLEDMKSSNGDETESSDVDNTGQDEELFPSANIMNLGGMNDSILNPLQRKQKSFCLQFKDTVKNDLGTSKYAMNLFLILTLITTLVLLSNTKQCYSLLIYIIKMLLV